MRRAERATTPTATPTLAYSVLEQWNIALAEDGGFGRVIVVDPSQRSEKGLLALAEQLRQDTNADHMLGIYSKIPRAGHPPQDPDDDP